MIVVDLRFLAVAKAVGTVSADCEGRLDGEEFPFFVKGVDLIRNVALRCDHVLGLECDVLVKLCGLAFLDPFTVGGDKVLHRRGVGELADTVLRVACHRRDFSVVKAVSEQASDVVVRRSKPSHDASGPRTGRGCDQRFHILRGDWDREAYHDLPCDLAVELHTRLSTKGIFGFSFITKGLPPMLSVIGALTFCEVFSCTL